MSQATVTATSPAAPESATMLACASPRLFAMPPTVRRYALALKRSAASTIASSFSESLRRIGSDATVSSPAGRPKPSRSPRPRRRRRRSPAVALEDGEPLERPRARRALYRARVAPAALRASGARVRTARAPAGADRRPPGRDGQPLPAATQPRRGGGRHLRVGGERARPG